MCDTGNVNNEDVFGYYLKLQEKAMYTLAFCQHGTLELSWQKQKHIRLAYEDRGFSSYSSTDDQNEK